MISNPISMPLRAVIIGGWMAVLVWWERRRALRRVVESKLRRDARNATVAAPAGVVMQFLELPVAFGLATQVEAKKWGLLQQIPAPSPLRAILALVLLDYTLYVWHVLTHRVGFLWRFHQVHHIDREMDATTALRFHFGEIAISVAFRAAQVFDHRAFTVCSCRLADLSLSMHLVSPLKRSAAACMGAAFSKAHCHSAAPRNPSFDCSGRSKFELVQRADNLGLVTPHAPNRCSTGLDRDWRTRLPGRLGSATRDSSIAAVPGGWACARATGKTHKTVHRRSAFVMQAM